jgi:PII-like signaling protein
VSEDRLKLTTYFGERERANGGFLADALTEIYARHRLQTSVVMRGIGGFGAKQHLHTDRLLSLSEDLPLVSVAVDGRARIEAALSEVDALRFGGLVTVEGVSGLLEPDAAAKLTVYLGRGDRTYEAVVDLLHRRGIAGATVLLGVDGTVCGERQRATFFGRNAAVPLMVIAVGDSGRIAAVLPELGDMLVTVERVRICKRDGHGLAEPEHVDPGRAAWQKLMVYASEQTLVDGQPLHQRLIRELRAAGAAGATSLRGIWGYHGDHRPHGDSFWQLRRRVPVVTVIVDTPERIRRWFTIVDRLSAGTGLVTSEVVLRAA